MIDRLRARALDAGRPVRRRHRARDPPPALRAVRLPRPEGHGARGSRGAVRTALQPGDDHEAQPVDGKDREDVEVARQHRLARRADRPLRGRHGARLHALHRSAREGVRVVRGRRSRRLPVPEPRPRARRRAWRRSRPRTARPPGEAHAARAARAPDDPESHRGRRAVPLPHRRRRPDGVPARDRRRRSRRGSEDRRSLARRRPARCSASCIPLAPHLSEEWWERLGGERTLLETPWPAFDPALADEPAGHAGRPGQRARPGPAGSRAGSARSRRPSSARAPTRRSAPGSKARRSGGRSTCRTDC